MLTAMKLSRIQAGQNALSLVELLVVLAIVSIMMALLMPRLRRSPCSLPFQTTCKFNLKQIALATMIYEEDYHRLSPFDMSRLTPPPVNRPAHSPFLVLSNYLRTPQSLTCPADANRAPTTNWKLVSFANVSYFINVDQYYSSNICQIAFGDRNLTNGTQFQNFTLTVRSNDPVEWTSELHQKHGNVAFTDGHVEFFASPALRNRIHQTVTQAHLLLP